MASRAVAGAVRAAALTAAVSSSTEIAESRSAEPLVFDGSSSWHLLEQSDIDEASSLVGAASGASKALALAKKMAAKPEVQRAFASELGLGEKNETNLLQGEPSSSTEAMLELIETLRLENDSLQASNAATRAALDERARVEVQMRSQDELLEAVVGEPAAEARQDGLLEAVEPAAEVAREENLEEEEEEKNHQEEEEEPDTSSDARLAAELAADLAAEDKRRFDAIKSQEAADELFAQHLAGEEAEKQKSQDDDLIFAQHIANNANGEEDEEEEEEDAADKKTKQFDQDKDGAEGAKKDDEPPLLEIAMALAGIILVVALTRKLTPGLGKKALALGAAACAAIYAKAQCTTF